MIKEAIDKILRLAAVEQFEIAGRKYTSKGIVPVAKPTPAPLTVHTLSGLVDYLTKEIDYLKEAQNDHFIHVVSPCEVVISAAFNGNGFFERPAFITATFEPPNIQCGQYASLESFIIGLQAFFVPTEISAALLRVVGNLKGEQFQQFADDGMTQAVTAKAGLSTLATVPVPNPVILKPYRTFPEIDQPESLFVFRMKQQEGQAPACGLWEADNKQWKITAIKGIAAWLQEKLPNVPIIA
jgi:hypothetical protein